MRVFWANDEKTILIRELSKQWTWPEYQLSLLKMRQLLQEVEHGVSIIIDMRQVEAVPREALHHFQAGSRNLPADVQKQVLVSKNRLVSRLYQMLIQISPCDFNTFYFASSLEEAFQKIADAQNQKAS
jgi:hypothetical protein